MKRPHGLTQVLRRYSNSNHFQILQHIMTCTCKLQTLQLQKDKQSLTSYVRTRRTAGTSSRTLVYTWTPRPGPGCVNPRRPPWLSRATSTHPPTVSTYSLTSTSVVTGRPSCKSAASSRVTSAPSVVSNISTCVLVVRTYRKYDKEYSFCTIT